MLERTRNTKKYQEIPRNTKKYSIYHLCYENERL